MSAFSAGEGAAPGGGGFTAQCRRALLSPGAPLRWEGCGALLGAGSSPALPSDEGSAGLREVSCGLLPCHICHVSSNKQRPAALW